MPPLRPIFVPTTASRLWARAIDAAIVGVFLAPAFGWSWFFADHGEAVTIPWALLVYLVAVPVLYETLAIWIFGQTFGKWVFSLHVVSARDDRRAADGWQSLLRAFAGRSTLIFSHGPHAFMFFRYDRTHLIDWVAGTRVVASRVRPDRPAPRVALGLIAVFIFGSAGWMTASGFMRDLGWDRHGVTFGLAEPAPIRSF